MPDVMNATTLTLSGSEGRSFSIRSLGHVLVLSGVVVTGIALFVLVGLHGWSYYATPVTVRGYSSLHRMLRPSGTIGQWFGISGFVLMLVPVAYSLRKKIARLRSVGSMKTWLEVHIFCGVVGPVFVTFHTSFRFNGIVSVAYWSMVAVVLSGFIGRYLYVRIPRSLRGLELTRAELDARADALSQRLSDAQLPAALLARIADFERRVVPSGSRSSVVGLLFGEVRVLRELSSLRQAIEQAGVSPALLHEVAGVIAERAALLRQNAYLSMTKSLFDIWHVFHMPLVYVMFGIVVLHVAFTLYMGYLPSLH
jgi:hypothetical protein